MAARTLSPIVALMTLLSNILLTLSFLRTLLQYREGGLKANIMQNKRTWIVICLDFLVALCVIILRCVVFTAVVKFSFPMESFSAHIYAVVMLSTYRNYITVTTDVAKGILQTQIQVSHRTNGNTAGVSTKA
ncbi:hypothetical protein BKA69DRAFT_1124567 [Paraphysoderma sedebokerense]|nr:hypothetical protein BKA69DRAFT_1124567 [Paraphysoderma sedebokerense]